MKYLSKGRSLMLLATCGLLLASCTDPEETQPEDMSYDEQYVLEEGASDTTTMEFSETDTMAVAETPVYEDIMANNMNVVNFAFDKSELNELDKGKLDKVAEFIMANPGKSYIVEGHTDDRGTDAYNLALGERRASMVKDYLVSKGVDMAIIKTVSYGSMRPSLMGADTKVWAANRRAVIVYSND